MFGSRHSEPTRIIIARAAVKAALGERSTAASLYEKISFMDIHNENRHDIS
jgi:hypothetical protein